MYRRLKVLKERSQDNIQTRQRRGNPPWKKTSQSHFVGRKDNNCKIYTDILNEQTKICENIRSKLHTTCLNTNVHETGIRKKYIFTNNRKQ